MKKLFRAFIAALCFALPLIAQAELKVFACEPEWAALAEEIGGDRLSVFSATHAGQDAHYIRARPSLIAKARTADLLICSGADLEVGWLPILLQKASAKIQRGAIGHLMAADQVSLLEKPTVLDRSMGDVHPQGNPHTHLNPHNILIVAEELSRRLALIDTVNAAVYRSRYASFSTRWRQAISRWEDEAASLKGVPVVAHHKSFTYLLEWLGLERVAFLEPRPGIPPTISHLQLLLQTLKERPARMIIRAPYEPDDASLWVAEKTGIPAVVLPYTVGGDERSQNLFTLFDRSIDLLKKGRHAG